MPPFVYQPYSNEYGPSIAQALQNAGTIQAQGALREGDIAANAALQSGMIRGQMWGTLGNAIGQLPSYLQQQRQNARLEEIQNMQLDAARRDQKTRNVFEAELQNPANLNPDGSINDTALTQRLRASDVGAWMHYQDIAAKNQKAKLDYMKGVADITKTYADSNKSEADTQDLLGKVRDKQKDYLGDLAFSALTTLQARPDDALHARDTVNAMVAQGMSAGAISPQSGKQFLLATASATPDQLAGIFRQVIPQEKIDAHNKAVAEMYKPVTVGGDSSLVQPPLPPGTIGGAVGPAPPPTPRTPGQGLDVTGLPGGATSAAPAPAGAPSAGATVLFQGAPKKLSPEEMALEAYAQSLGLTSRTDLTYGDLQTFDRNKAAITSSAEFQRHMQARLFDNANQPPEKAPDQGKLEQQYRTVLTRAISSRAGGLGAEDAKVLQANHLLSAFEQSFNPQTGGYDIPPVQQRELALGLARLMAPGGSAGVQMMNEVDQRTLKGDIAGALSYITGQKVSGTPQAIATMYKDMIERQGQTAVTNREGGMGYLRSLAPTDLEESRRQQLETASLTPLRQSRVTKDPKTGQYRLEVSTDGGATWSGGAGTPSARPAGVKVLSITPVP